MKSQKITSKSRWYDDACGAAHGLELLGERWSLLIVRELMFGPRRFSAIRAGLSGISANVLTQRLEGLESAGVLRRIKLPPPASVQAYELTAWGYEAAPIFVALGAWAARSPGHDASLSFSAASLMLSFRTMFDPARLQDARHDIGFRFEGDEFRVVLSRDGVDARRAPADGAQVILDTDPATVASLIYGGRPLEDAEAAGALKIIGDREAFRRLSGLFPMPEKAEVPAA